MKYKKDEGNAGISILLSLIVGMFIVGLLVMIFVIMGASLMGSTDDPTAIGVINDTTQSLATSTDFFDLFIVIGSMVVLILLVVVIIVAIRGTGWVGGGGA